MAPLLLLFGATLSAADRYVDPANVCGGNLPCYTTIHAAVTASLTGDVIHVGPGAYPETVTINESLTLLGAQATVNPNDALWNDTRTIVANESVIQGPVNLSLRNDIVIDGFTIERRELLGDLSRAAWETVRAMMAEAAGDSGVRPGMVVVPQTFGSSVNAHPHVHAIASRGG